MKEQFFWEDLMKFAEEEFGVRLSVNEDEPPMSFSEIFGGSFIIEPGNNYLNSIEYKPHDFYCPKVEIEKCFQPENPNIAA